ncbi:hypothetical protein [Alloyangia pacifica]|uniref:Peptidase M41 domain-containing protein n=1 Tax=Alloyangia pacifica TaxID=311180 RepID=A0A1I6PP09_9RHOB|nr:hypothetical protein [Alloyangia pacifica]SDG32238.1 hypothetical protein SAMN04488245_102365 [Alloyangia pacifica]SFS41808.1 hypothetical protein SAMN04488050_101666 [Alloyangia pacifica]
MTRTLYSHECGHGIAGSLALAMLEPSRYPDALITIHVSEGEGSSMIEIGQPEENRDDLRLSQKVASLSAIGPVAQHPEALQLLHKGDWPALIEAGDLSEQDVALLRSSNMPDISIRSARIIAGVQAVRKRLGAGGWQRLTKACRDWDVTHLGPMKLETFAPIRAMQQALSEGDRIVTKLVEGPSAIDRIKQKTEHERRVRG